jgi:phage tail sheath protein FI
MASTLNLGTVKTPGVYIDEMSLFPPSVAQVDTAIPAFIGPTRIAYQIGQPVRISSMVEFRSFYGGGPDRDLTITLDSNNSVTSVAAQAAQYLHDSLLMFFNNGGEKCYVVSTRDYSSTHTAKDYTDALDALLRFDEPTLIVMPDAARLSAGDFASVQQATLAHCNTMQDRFAILDVKMEPTQRIPSSDAIAKTLEDFRTSVGTSNLKYGAAYYPYLQTTLPLTVSYARLSLKQGTTPKTFKELLPATDIAVSRIVDTLDNLVHDAGIIRTKLPAPSFYAGVSNKGFAITDSLAAFVGITGLTSPDLGKEFTAYTKPAAGTVEDNILDAIVAGAASTEADELDAAFVKLMDYTTSFANRVDAKIAAQEQELSNKSPLYASIARAATSQGIILPPSGAIAGAYARTDADRGVWKSPANVSLNYVAAPIVALTDAQQEALNVDVDSGKSINAVRAFTGKGTLVWGARTLAGSDNEWRYVAVRRFFLMAEESIKKATAQFVFEANDANTWVRVRAMIENFLTLQWRAGALAGVKAENAFFVRVGLGQTMTPQNVLDGFMIIEIGMAVVRPAEFIVLRFSHKMQEA